MGCGALDSLILKVKQRWKPPPATAQWGLRITADELAKLHQGFKSQQMEQKWDIKPEGPDEQGVSLIRITRSWTGYEVYKVTVVGRVREASGEGEPEQDGAEIVEFTWDQKCDPTEEEAKYTIAMLFRGLLQCELAGFPETTW